MGVAFMGLGGACVADVLDEIDRLVDVGTSGSLAEPRRPRIYYDSAREFRVRKML